MIADIGHRPWLLPTTRPAMDMSWHDLLFMHWPVKAEQLRCLIPKTLNVDTFEGEAWISVVPFRMSRVKPYKFPSIPRCSAFPELNVRTYVSVGEKPGVWFFSLDAANPFAVAVARRVFHLPYFNARMSFSSAGDSLVYSSTRTHRGAPQANFNARYGPNCALFNSGAGSLEYWLTERYCLYAEDRNQRLWRTEIHHKKWPLQPAEIEIRTNTMTQSIGVNLPDVAPVLQFAKKLDVIAWKPQLVSPN